jgi:hypothetical protein
MAYKQGKNPFGRNPLNFNSPLNSFDSLVGKLMNQGKSKEAATKIAGKIANMKMKGAGSGPTAAQKARAKGAPKMEDLSGDGKITKKDVLIGRGVIEKDGSPAKAHDKKLKALERRIKRVRQSKEGSEGQGGIDYELLAQLEDQKKKLIESHGKEAKDGNAKPSPANHAGHPGGDPTKDARGNKKQEPLSTSIRASKITTVEGDDPGAKVKPVRAAKRLTQADLDKTKSTAKSKGIVSSEGRDGSNRQERKKRRQERRSIRKNKDLSASQKRMAIKESRQQQKDNVRGVKKDSPAKAKMVKQVGRAADKAKKIDKAYRKEAADAKSRPDYKKFMIEQKRKGKKSPTRMKSPMKKDGKKGDLLSKGADAVGKAVKRVKANAISTINKKIAPKVKKGIKAVKKFAKEQQKVAT